MTLEDSGNMYGRAGFVETRRGVVLNVDKDKGIRECGTACIILFEN